jgi:hypothetical protein
VAGLFTYHTDATLYWKTGFHQRVVIQRAMAAIVRSGSWTDEENKLLEMLWLNSTLAAVQEALPQRTLSAIRNHARRLSLKRQRKTNSTGTPRRWTSQEEARACELYRKGTSVSEMAIKLDRTQSAVMQRVAVMKCHDPSWAGRRKKPVVWQNMDLDFRGFQEESSRGGFAPSLLYSPFRP